MKQADYFGREIKRIREDKKFSVRQTALQAQMSNSYLSQIENGLVNIPKPITLEKLAHGLRVPKQTIFKLAGLTNTITDVTGTVHSTLIDVPIIGEIACGSPIIANENIDSYLPTRSESLPNGTNFYLKCRGASMEPKIPDGAYVLIHQQPAVENGQIAAVLLNDNETTLKRVQYQGDQVILVPDNPAPTYQPIILNQDNPGKIIGRAIQVQFNL